MKHFDEQSDPAPHLSSLRALRDELRRRGWYRPTTGRILLECAVHLAFLAGGTAAFFWGTGAAAAAAGVIVATFGSFGLATNAHTASHGAIARRRWRNEILTWIGYPLLLGMSASWWRHKHISVHHRAPNVVGIDADIDLGPWFAIHEGTLREGGRLHLWYRFQWLVAPLAIALNGLSMLIQAWSFLLKRLVNRRKRRAGDWVDLGALVLHLGLWLVLPTAMFSLAEASLFYAARAVLMGYTMFIAFAPAHFPEAAICVDSSAARHDPVLAITATTVNFRTGWLGRFLCAGVEFQIEHHLFPRISHVHYPQLAPLVAAYCRRHGYPYRTLGWGRGVWESLRVFRVPKRIATSFGALPG